MPAVAEQVVAAEVDTVVALASLMTWTMRVIVVELVVAAVDPQFGRACRVVRSL